MRGCPAVGSPTPSVTGKCRRRRSAQAGRPTACFGLRSVQGRAFRAAFAKERDDAKTYDTQAILLSAAAAYPDHGVLPPPDTISLKGAALDRTLRALVAVASLPDAGHRLASAGGGVRPA
jgi:hypothetical protein